MEDQSFSVLSDFFQDVSEAERRVEVAKEVLSGVAGHSSKTIFLQYFDKKNLKITLNGFSKFFKENNMEVHPETLEMLFGAIDFNEDGVIGEEELVRFLRPAREADKSYYAKQLNSDVRQYLMRVFEEEMKCINIISKAKNRRLKSLQLKKREIFEALDSGDKNFLLFDDIFQFIKKHVQNITEDAAMRAFRRIDINKDGCITYIEWNKMFTNMGTQISSGWEHINDTKDSDTMQMAKSRIQDSLQSSTWLSRSRSKQSILSKDQTSHIVSSTRTLMTGGRGIANEHRREYQPKSRESFIHRNKQALSNEEKAIKSVFREPASQIAHKRNQCSESPIQRREAKNTNNSRIEENKQVQEIRSRRLLYEPRDRSWLKKKNRDRDQTTTNYNLKEFALSISSRSDLNGEYSRTRPSAQEVCMSAKNPNNRGKDFVAIRSDTKHSRIEPEEYRMVMAHLPSSYYRKLEAELSIEAVNSRGLPSYQPSYIRKSSKDTFTYSMSKDDNSARNQILCASKDSNLDSKNIWLPYLMDDEYANNNPSSTVDDMKVSSCMNGYFTDDNSEHKSSVSTLHDPLSIDIPNLDKQFTIKEAGVLGTGRFGVAHQSGLFSRALQDQDIYKEESYLERLDALETPRKLKTLVPPIFKKNEFSGSKLFDSSNLVSGDTLLSPGAFSMDEISWARESHFSKILNSMVLEFRKLEEARISLSLRYDFVPNELYEIVLNISRGRGIDCDTMYNFLQEIRSDIDRQECELVFKGSDRDRNGFISKSEFFEMLCPFGQDYRDSLFSRKPRNIRQLSSYSQETITEIRRTCELMFDNALNSRNIKDISNTNIIEIFGAIDHERKSQFRVNDVLALLGRHGYFASFKEILAVMKRFDLNLDGKVTLDEFMFEMA